jgi:hypothetical protein
MAVANQHTYQTTKHAGRFGTACLPLSTIAARFRDGERA